MNDTITQLLIWGAAGLLGIVNVLISSLVRTHLKSDDEHRVRIDREIAQLRQRMHDVGNAVARLETAARHAREDELERRKGKR